MPDDTVPPTSLAPAVISLTLAGFQTLAPGGGAKALPYFQVAASKGPWLTAPGGATCRALLSTPAGAGQWKLALSRALLRNRLRRSQRQQQRHAWRHANRHSDRTPHRISSRFAAIARWRLAATMTVAGRWRLDERGY